MTYEEIVTQMRNAIAGIRNAIYGVEVREHIAVAMENVLEVGQAVMNKGTAIEQSEANAKASESNAIAQAASAKQWAENSATSANSAASYANNAATLASNAQQWANNASSLANSAAQSAQSAKADADRAAAIVSTDKTLTLNGSPADAKAVGDALKNYLGIWTVTLPVGSWASSGDISGYPYKCTVWLETATSSTVPSAVPTPASFATASAVGLASICETQNGVISFWAESVPTSDIQMQVSLIGRT